VFIARDMVHDAGAKLIGVLARRQPLHQAKKTSIAHHGPSRLGVKLRETAAIGLVAGALGVGSFLGTAVGTRLHIHRPASYPTFWQIRLPRVSLGALVGAIILVPIRELLTLGLRRGRSGSS